MYTDVFDEFLRLYADFFLLDNALASLLAIISNMWLFITMFGFVLLIDKKTYKYYIVFWSIVTLLLVGDYFIDFKSILRSEVIQNNGDILHVDSVNYNGYFNLEDENYFRSSPNITYVGGAYEVNLDAVGIDFYELKRSYIMRFPNNMPLQYFIGHVMFDYDFLWGAESVYLTYLSTLIQYQLQPLDGAGVLYIYGVSNYV